MVGLCLILYESHRYSKFNLNSLPLSYIKYQHLGYLLNQNLLTNHAMQSEFLSKISSDASASLPSTVIVLSRRTRGNSTISNQLDVGCGVYHGESHEVYDWAIFAFKSVRTNKVDT